MSQQPNRFLKTFIISLLVCAGATLAWAGEGITAVTTTTGRTIFINTSDVPHPNTFHSTSAAAATGTPRYMYWSNTGHRWKAVPASLIVNRARSAAAEVLAAQGASSAGQSKASDGSGATYISSEKVDHSIELAAARHNVDPDLVRAVIKVESNFNPHAVSRKGAMGLMQLMPATARSMNVANPFDPTENVDAGVRHLRTLMDNFGGNLAMSLAAYNAGSRAVEQHNGVPPYRETQDYVRRITALYKGGDLMGAAVRRPIRISHDSEGHLLFSNTE